jgi:hypothetical protein
MSIVEMVDNKVALEKRKTANGDPAPGGVETNVINQIVAFIPTEIITLWVALIALLSDPKAPAKKAACHADWGTHWILAAVFAVMAMGLTLGLAYRKFKDTNGIDFKWPLFGMLAAPAAFLAWAISLPEGPLRSACWYSDEAGAFVVLATTIAITTLGYIFGQTARFERV